jgi:hypothetical protein
MDIAAATDTVAATGIAADTATADGRPTAAEFMPMAVHPMDTQVADTPVVMLAAVMLVEATQVADSPAEAMVAAVAVTGKFT